MKTATFSPNQSEASRTRPQSVGDICLWVFAASSALSLCLLVTGCSLTPIAKHTAALSTVTTQVIINSEDAYRAAIELHDQEQVSAGVLQVEAGKSWDYDQITPLLTPEALKARIQILDALKAYSYSLTTVTSGLDSPALTAAATSTGANLKSLGSTIITAPGLAQSGFAITPQTANIVSTATLALGEYLESKKVNAALPALTAQMDPHVEALCNLLADDIVILRRQSKKDYDDLSRQEWTFIQLYKDKLSPIELRTEVEKLPTYRKNQQSTDATLANLRSAVADLALTHHALAAAAQGNNPEALTARLADLQAAGTSLKTYYSSLPAK